MRLLKRRSHQRIYQNNHLCKQAGVMLIEALVAILIISFGILGLVGLQARSIADVAQARYRNEAAQLANRIVGEIWSNNPTAAQIAALNANPNPSWVATAANTLPAGAVLIATNAPTRQITITINWQPPSETLVRRYVQVAFIGGST